MMDVNSFLLMVLYILGAILLVVLIVLGIKLLNILNRFDSIVDNVSIKVKKFDKIFNTVDVVTDSMALVSDKLVDGISEFLRRIFSKNKRKDDDYE